MTKSFKDYFYPIEFSYYLIALMILCACIPLHAKDIEEIVVRASYRDTALNQNDGSILVIDEDRLDGEPMKHFEQLSFLIPNLNFSASDSRPRYFQIRGIGERSGYEGTPNSSVGFMIDDMISQDKAASPPVLIWNRLRCIVVPKDQEWEPMHWLV